MITLLEQRHPDIDTSIVKTTKVYKYLTEAGNIIECLERKSLDTDFVDVTAIEQEKQLLEKAIAKEEREITRAKRGALYLFHENGDWVDINDNIYEVTIDEVTGEKLWYRHGKPTVYRLLEEDANNRNCIKVVSD